VRLRWAFLWSSWRIASDRKAGATWPGPTPKAHAQSVRRGARRTACWPGPWLHHGRPQEVSGASGRLTQPTHHRLLEARQALMVRQPGGARGSPPSPWVTAPPQRPQATARVRAGSTLLRCVRHRRLGRAGVPRRHPLRCPRGGATRGRSADRHAPRSLGHARGARLPVGGPLEGCAWGRHRDCQGLLRRLDTLHGLGVTALWPLLFQPSPQGDDGDDGAEYDGGAPRDGTHAREAAV
jgi:hypothetical protein